MVFQSTIVFIHFLLCMVHPTKSLASVGLAQARPNNTKIMPNARFRAYLRVSGFSGMEWWTGTVEWNGGLEWWNGMD